MLETRVTERTRELALANSTLQAERVELVATLRRLEETQGQLLQAEKMAAIGQLAAGVAHEINNPIGFVTSNLGSLTNYLTQLFELVACYEKVGVALPAAQQKFVKEARARCEVDYLREDAPQLLAETRDGLARVKRIVDNLREYSHVGEAQWAPADLNQVLESALNVVRNELRYKAELVKELTPLPPLRCIVAQLSQVLVNLLVNAAQSIQDKGTITLRTRFSGGSISVEIGDTGCGMTEETRKRIFEPFFTTKPVGKGTGLGLSISWEIIKRHHGDIEVTSAPGKGTTFRITLPVEAT
jgi:signal transduction histidine kinase